VYERYEECTEKRRRGEEKCNIADNKRAARMQLSILNCCKAKSKEALAYMYSLQTRQRTRGYGKDNCRVDMKRRGY
jgi:hypothetical protein